MLILPYRRVIYLCMNVYLLAGKVLSRNALISFNSASEELCVRPWYATNSMFFINVFKNEVVICPHLNGTTGSQSPCAWKICN